MLSLRVWAARRRRPDIVVVAVMLLKTMYSTQVLLYSSPVFVASQRRFADRVA